MLAMVQHDELDSGRRRATRGLERTCALTRAVLPVSEMVRFVVGPDATVVPDVKRKLPGRGLWIMATRAANAEAVKRNVFARGFKRDAKAGPALVQETEWLLEQAALDALSIACKAGLVLTGATKIEGGVGRDRIEALIHAADGGADGKRKLDAALRRTGAEKSGETAIIETFTGAQLDLALSRSNVIHAALLAGPVSETFLSRVRRLQRFRADDRARAQPMKNAPEFGAQDQGRQ